MVTVLKRHHLREYDYSSPGFYFITICAERNITNRQPHVLGTIINAEIHLSPMGLITQDVWNHLPDHFSNVLLDAFCIMPNHIHGILQLTAAENEEYHSISPDSPMSAYPLSQIIASLKSFSTRTINQMNGTTGQRFWQRNYYDHIIRNEKSLQAIRTYIDGNPYHWKDADYYSG